MRLLVGVEACAEEGDGLAERGEASEEADQSYGCVDREHAVVQAQATAAAASLKIQRRENRRYSCET